MEQTRCDHRLTERIPDHAPMSFAALAYGTAEHADARVSVDTDLHMLTRCIRVRDVAFLGGNAAISGWPFTDAHRAMQMRAHAYYSNIVNH